MRLALGDLLNMDVFCFNNEIGCKAFFELLCISFNIGKDVISISETKCNVLF